MALMKQARPPADAAVIPLLAEDPVYARLSAVSDTLSRDREHRQTRLDLLRVETYLGRNGGAAQSARQREVAAKLRSKLPGPPVESPAPSLDDSGDLPENVVAALRLSDGGAIPPAPGYEAKVAQLQSEIELLDDALRTMHMRLDDIRDERSADVAKSLVPRHREILRRYLERAVALSAAVSEEAAFYGEYLAAGYGDRPDILNRPPLRGAARLGSLDEWDSEICQYRRFLEAQGVVR